MHNISLQSFGAYNDEVTGSKHLLKIGDENYLIDYGAWQGNQEDDKKNKEFICPISIDQITSVILTHAHYDHCGLLPKLIKQGYKGVIRSTPATRDLASIVMMDAAKIQSYEKEPNYTETDVVNTINQFRCHFYHKEKQITSKTKVTFYDAGHILGSSLVDFEIDNRNIIEKFFHKKPLHVLFTGDLGRTHNPIVNKPETNFPSPNYIILESTYGNRLHTESKIALTEFANIINRTINREGKVIIPSFAIERAQEIIYYLKCLMQEEKIPRIPVYIDSPMAINATGAFNIHPECFNNEVKDRFLSKGKNPFSIATLHCINDFTESIKVARSRKPCIIIAANGMCEAGRIRNHLKYGVGDSRNTIIIVGYMGEHTLGRDILEKSPIITIDEKEYELRAEVQSISAFSSHSDYQETLNWLKQVDTSNLRKIFLVHGDKDAKEFLKNLLINNGYKNVEIVKNNYEYQL